MKTLQKIIWWLQDYVYLVFGHIRPIVYRRLPATYRDENGAAGDIVLFPGVMTRWHFLKDIGDHFAVRGYTIHVVPGIFYNTRSIAREAEELHQYLEEHDLRDVTIIAHSKGGLIGKHYMEDDNTADFRVRKLIAIASPFNGSTLAAMAPSSALREFAPDSPMVKDLLQKERFSSSVVSVFPTWDNHVVHEHGSYLHGAKNIEVPSHGHHKLLFDGTLIEILEEELLIPNKRAS